MTLKQHIFVKIGQLLFPKLLGCQTDLNLKIEEMRFAYSVSP